MVSLVVADTGVVIAPFFCTKCEGPIHLEATIPAWEIVVTPPVGEPANCSGGPITTELVYDGTVSFGNDPQACLWSNQQTDGVTFFGCGYGGTCATPLILVIAREINPPPVIFWRVFWVFPGDGHNWGLRLGSPAIGSVNGCPGSASQTIAGITSPDAGSADPPCQGFPHTINGLQFHSMTLAVTEL